MGALCCAQPPRQKKVAIVCTSADRWKMRSDWTGLWLETAACPYYAFKAAGFDVTLASITGSEPTLDKLSGEGSAFYTEDCKRFEADPEAREKFRSTKAVQYLNEEVKYPSPGEELLDGIFLAGGHGMVIDGTDHNLTELLDYMYKEGKVIGAVGHGQLALQNCKKPDGTALVAGHEMTVVSDEEEKMIGTVEKYNMAVYDGFLPEKKFRELGAKYSCAAPGTSHVVTSGKLVTGQNPQSTPATAKAFIDVLKKMEV